MHSLLKRVDARESADIVYLILMLASKNEVYVTTRNGVMAHFILIHYMPV